MRYTTGTLFVNFSHDMDPYENPESHSNKTLWIIAGIIFTVMVIALLYGLSQKTLLRMDRDDTSVSSSTPTPSSKSKDVFAGKETIGTPVTTTSLEVVNLETNPPQVQAHLSYELAGNCSVLSEPEVTHHDQEFTVTLTARAPKDNPCSSEKIPGETVINLPVTTLHTGTYHVIAGKQKATFTLQALEQLAPTADK